MTEERITETRTPNGETHTHTTVIHDNRPADGGGKWLLVALVVILAIVGIWAFSQFGAAEVAKDNAVAGAANDVGEAAGQIGNAAQDAADTLGE